MARKNDGSAKRVYNRGAWTDEEDRKLAQYIEIHGANKWRTVATKSGLNRCGKSCRLRWLNYLRPNIKRGNISDEEEDLILRLHKLLGNRWSLIAGRLPGRTDNEIKNYWNSHLSKKSNQKAETSAISTTRDNLPQRSADMARVEKEWMEGNEDMDGTTEVEKEWMEGSGDMDGTTEVEKEWMEGSGVMDDNIDVNEFFNFSSEGTYGLEWVNKFLELDEEP